jgi:hypothetical protein
MRSGVDGLGYNPAAPAVLFLDLNSAFASIEQQYRPELRGKPVAVCPGAVRASIVISASREARALGVRTLMRVYEALPICPDLVVLEPAASRYREVSERLLRLLDSYSPRVLPLSIDEAAVDLAGTPSLRRDALDLGREIKRRLRDEVGDWLTCSIGFSTNIFLAKQVAELEKPVGLQVIDHRNLEQVFSRLQLTDLTGDIGGQRGPDAAGGHHHLAAPAPGQPAHAAPPGVRLDRRRGVVPPPARLRDGVVRGGRAEEHQPLARAAPAGLGPGGGAGADAAVLRPPGPPGCARRAWSRAVWRCRCGRTAESRGTSTGARSGWWPRRISTRLLSAGTRLTRCCRPTTAARTR